MNETKPPLEWQACKFHWLTGNGTFTAAHWTQDHWQISGNALRLSPFEVAGSGWKWYAAAMPPMEGYPAIVSEACKHTWNYDPQADELICPSCKLRRKVQASSSERPKA